MVLGNYIFFTTCKLRVSSSWTLYKTMCVYFSLLSGKHNKIFLLHKVNSNLEILWCFTEGNKVDGVKNTLFQDFRVSKLLFLCNWHFLNDPTFNCKQQMPLLKLPDYLLWVHVLKYYSRILSRPSGELCVWPCTCLFSSLGVYLNYKFVIEDLKTWVWCL